MDKNKRLDTLAALGQHLAHGDEYLEALMHRTAFHNAWFTIENQQLALDAIRRRFLQRPLLEAWANRYPVAESGPLKTIGLVMAGNIPLVGFHDLVCTFAAGHKAQIKLSEKDKFLLPYLLQLMERLQPGASQYFEIVERLAGFDAVIATGSNNTSRYFEAYFGKYPHIIRRNRNAVAVLDGSESNDELKELGKDIFRYFGLGCRNVSKIWVPRGYDFDPLLETLHEYRDLILHDKYKHNFDYNLAIFILNRTPHRHNGCLILVENPAIPSRIATVHYEYYDDLDQVQRALEAARSEIQCVVGSQRLHLSGFPIVPFGQSQQPSLDDYPDGVDVMAFLTSL